MAKLPTLPQRTLIEKISIGLAAILLFLGVTTSAAWLAHVAPLLQLGSSLPPIRLNESLCIVALGAALLVSEFGKQRLASVAAIPGLLALMTFFEHVAGADFHIDEMLGKDFLLVETAYPGRMSLMVAGCLVLGSAALAWRSVKRAESARLFYEAISGSIISSVGFSTLLGYAISLPPVYRWGSTTATSLLGGCALLVLGIALLLNAWRSSYANEGGPPSWSPMPPVIACFTLSIILWIGMREREMVFLASNTQNTLNSLASLVDLELRQASNELQDHIASPWSRAVDTNISLEADASTYFADRRNSGCIALGWIDLNGQARWVFPAEGNEGGVGTDHSLDEVRAKAMQTAAARQSAIISQTITIHQRQNPGFVIYAPIIRGGKIAGYAFAEFVYNRFFEFIDSKLKLSANYDCLVSVNGMPVSGKLREEDNPWNPHLLEATAVVQGRRMRFSISPNEDNLQRSKRYLPELTLASGLGITLLLGLSVHFARTARAGMLSAENSNRRLISENEERRRVEERLKTSDERLRLALDSTGIGIFEWNVTSGYVYYSAGFWAMLGYEHNRMAATVDTFQALISPEDITSFQRRIEAQLSGTTPYIDPEFRVRARSGDMRWVYWRARSVAFAPNGLPVRIIGTMQDVSSRREAEEALRASQAATRKLSLVASRTDNIVVILTPDGRVEWVNESFSRTFDYPLIEICGKRLAEFLSGADTDARSVGRIRAALATGQSVSTDIVQYSKEGRKYHLSYDIQPVRNRSSEIENFIAVASDITARVETEQALRRAKSEADAASRAKSEFLASMSHEIRTPMNGVIGMTSLLLETNLSQEQREYVNTIRNSGESLLTIINDILDFSKIESGKMELERLPFEVSACIEESLELFAVQAATKHLELVYHVERGVPACVLGDVTRLRQVLVNLVNNAVKFTPTGSISIEARIAPVDPAELGIPPGRLLVEFAVRDTGIGIPQDRINRLFKVFSQVDSSTTRKYGGTGLGLAICERLCSLMGGDIRVESVEGQGSTFIFTIQTEAAPTQREEMPPQLPEALTKAPILIIEDHPVGQKRIHQLLESWGAKVCIVSTSEQALTAAAGMPVPPCLVLADFDTLQGASALTKLAPIATPRLVMLPFGYAPPDDPADGQTYSFIAKPIRASGLYHTITNIFATSRPGIGTGTEQNNEPLLGELIPLDVLLVEDNPVNQKVALRFLNRLGYTADAASNGLEALAALETRHYHLVLMDLQMPEMDGLEASRQIRQRIPEERQPRIIALTANALRGDREQCLAAGMDDYITKPVKINEIADAIRRQFSLIT